MRPDNLFRSKEKNADGKHDYKIVDWQAVAYGAAGVEFCEFLFGSMPLDAYPRMDELLGIWWAQLTTKCPAAVKKKTLFPPLFIEHLKNDHLLTKTGSEQTQGELNQRSTLFLFCRLRATASRWRRKTSQ
jgi:hypothetical protein